MGGDKLKEDDYWEAELEIKGAKEPITVLINAGKEGPERKPFYISLSEAI